MIARIVGLLLGLGLAALGWAIVQPTGLVGAHLPPLPLGAFEPEHMVVGGAAILLGVVVFVAGLMPKGPPGGGSKKKRKSAGYVTDFTASAPMPLGETSGTEAALSSEPAEPVVPATPPPKAPSIVPEPASAGEFVAVRGELHALARKEDWSQAAALARRLPTLAVNDHERLLAAVDLGDLVRAQSRLDEAHEAYEDAASYGRALLAAAPGDPASAVALAGALTGVGDIASDEGRLDAALEAYEEVVALRRKLVAASSAPANRRALSLALERLADAREDRGHRVRALALYKESFDIAGALAAADPTAYGAELAITRERLAELEARLA